MAKQTFKEFLVELMVSDDPMQAIKDVKQAARNPDRYKQQQMAKTVDAQKDIQRDKEDPLQSDKLRIAKMKQQLTNQEKRLSQKERRAAKRVGVEPEAGGMA